MKVAAIVLCSAGTASMAAAELIAGWDFSQYRVDGSLDAGAGPVDSLPANYSDLDASYGAGGTAPGDSADFGTMYMDGSNGSTNVSEAAATPGPEAVAHANDTKANRDAPLTMSGAFPRTSFDAFNILFGEGQTFQSRTALTARAPVDVVFRADQGAVLDRTWEVSFAGWALNTVGSVTADVEFAADCSSYSFVDSVTLTEEEQTFAMPLANVNDDEVCVRLRLDNTNGQPVIDNVAVPEPGFAAMLAAGVLTLVGLTGRRRL